ncbi:MAG TPA: murein biosynthesis integral membrane protein MurJ, partial [Blastocatellia bacterium]
MQSTGIVMAAILLSRFLGFLREWTVAHQIGSGNVTDTYYAAFTLPDFLNYLVAGGALGVIFIPVFTKYLAEDREDEGWHVFSTVMSFMTLVLIILVSLGEILVPYLVGVIAPGFDPAEKARVVFLTRLMLPAQIFFYLGSVMAAVQYAKGRYLIPSLAAVIYNLGIILGGWLLSSRMGITGFAFGLIAGAFCGYILLQSIAVVRIGARFSPNLNLRHPGFRLFLKLAVPIMVALSVVISDEWIIRWFGSFLQPASITWLTYAKALIRVPLGVVSQAVGIASFPLLAQLYSENKLNDLNRILNTSIKGLIILLVPISAFTIVLSVPLVTLVFSHTRLRETDIHSTAAALVFFSLGMFAWGVQNLLTRGFYAARDTLTPAIIGTSFTFLNIPVYWFCMKHWQHLGLALASSIGIIGYTVTIFAFLQRRTKNREVASLLFFLLK